MDFDHLRTFLEVSRQKSFSRAAEKLHVTQPSISAQIRSLETSLGHRLLERGGGKVTLTAAGQRRLAEMQRQADQAQDELLAGLDAGERGQLNALLAKVLARHRPQPA